MMSIEVSAPYENGVLKPDHPLPIVDGQRVKVTVHEEIGHAERSHGLLGWTGDPEILRKIAEDDGFGVEEAP
jgi:predicted DNA-binding antitoxin AbrB/MazE fold protein